MSFVFSLSLGQRSSPTINQLHFNIARTYCLLERGQHPATETSILVYNAISSYTTASYRRALYYAISMCPEQFTHYMNIFTWWHVSYEIKFLVCVYSMYIA